ncbi:MAG: RNA polymerase subunit sigma-70 [Firmicutes bacterium]|nr:RNA polymerase subunit sigma-70 [Bacillota bacterium]
MTKYQKNMIIDCRTKGMGYKAIGNVLGLSRDIVRGFCKRCGLDGAASVMQKNIDINKEHGFLCSCCNKPIKQPQVGRRRRFCSDECRRDWWKENIGKGSPKETAMYKLTCTFCKKEFTSYGNKSRKYCSHECYITDRFGGKNSEL